MKRFVKYIVLAVVALVAAHSASAQYYSWGADPAYMRWYKLKGDKIDVIYPDTARTLGYKMCYYSHSIKPYIGFGYRHGPMKIPFIIHPENFSSNGMVMWLPKRVEILSSPAINSYSMPWLKQLAAHEYRHAVQYNNLNRGFVRVFRYLLGEQSSTIGLLFMPLWGMEGDATLSETQMSSFGRALQPSFTMHYRAVGNFTKERRNNDKWFCGSFREYIPDHYQLGYQLTAYANTKYDENVWNKIVRFAVRNPYVIATTNVGLRHFYKTSINKLVRETFADLNDHWNSLPFDANTATQVTPQCSSGYTQYRYPQMLDNGTILSMCKTLDRYNAFVVTDAETGKSRHLAYTGAVSSRPSEVVNGRVWWTEYRRSLLFAERINSKLCYMDVEQGRTQTFNRKDKVLYPTPVSKDELAWVEYFPNGEYNIVRGNPASKHEEYLRVKIPLNIEIHGLAYDNYTSALYFIATDDSGMWLGRVGKNREIEHLTEGAYITISDLRAKDGVLYFGSIQSGKDEVHCYDLRTSTERRISTSTYGSFSPMPSGDDAVLMTTYDRYGYHISRQGFERDTLPKVKSAKLPINLVNPHRKQWNLINLDTVRFIGVDSMRAVANKMRGAMSSKHKKPLRDKRFNGAAHLFNFHSWAPVSYDPFALSEEGALDFNLGATIMTQNLLSTANGFARWGWNAKEGHIFSGSFRYYGFGLNLSINATYGGTQQLYSAYTYLYDPLSEKYRLVLPGGKEEYVTNPITGKKELVLNEEPSLGKYYNIGLGASLPLYFQAGYHTRYMQISARYDYSNGKVAKLGNINISGGSVSNLVTIDYKEGLHLLQFGVGYQDMVQLAHKDFLPKWGQIISFNYALNPADDNFSHLVSVYGKAYFPGILKHHSLSIAGVYQTSIKGFQDENALSNLAFHSGRLVPRGFYTSEISNQNYVATSLNYAFPIWYPDGGIGRVIYFKRLRLNLGFDYASFNKTQLISDSNYQIEAINTRENIFAYGGDLSIDMNVLQMPSSATIAVTLSLYKPHGKKGVHFSAGLGLPF